MGENDGQIENWHWKNTIFYHAHIPKYSVIIFIGQSVNPLSLLTSVYPLCFIFLNPLLHISKTPPLVQLLAIHLASRTLLILAISTPSDACFMQHFHWHIITSSFGIIPISGISLFIPFSPDLWEGMTGATWFPQQSAALLRCGLHLCCWWSPFVRTSRRHCKICPTFNIFSWSVM